MWSHKCNKQSLKGMFNGIILVIKVKLFIRPIQTYGNCFGLAWYMNFIELEKKGLGLLSYHRLFNLFFSAVMRYRCNYFIPEF